MFNDADQQRARAAYHALPEYARRARQLKPEPGTTPDELALTPYEYQLFSQNGEDGVLLELLRRIGVAHRTFVEFGIESGREGNCVALADILGWHGLFIEADGALHYNLHQKYRWNPHITTLHATVTPDTIEHLLTTGGADPEPDIMSIDIDGGDYWIWNALQHYRPRILVIEYNAGLDPDHRRVQPPDTGPWDGTAFFGASLGALTTLAHTKGYQLAHCELAGANAFFVRTDAAHHLPHPDQVQRRGPNYFLTAHGHPHDPTDRTYTDV